MIDLSNQNVGSLFITSAGTLAVFCGGDTVYHPMNGGSLRTHSADGKIRSDELKNVALDLEYEVFVKVKPKRVKREVLGFPSFGVRIND